MIRTNVKLETTNATLERALYFQRIALADRELGVNNLRRVDQLLAECPPDLRGWEWKFLKRARAGYAPVICRAGTQVVDVTFSPDGQRLATVQLDGTAVIWDAGAGTKLRVLQCRGGVRGVAFSPDGCRLAAKSSSEGGRPWPLARPRYGTRLRDN